MFGVRPTMDVSSTLCAFLHEHQPGDKTPLPQQSDHFPPLEVLEHTQVEKMYLDGWCMCCG